MTRVLITGPTGFIGRHCLQRLTREECEIHAVCRHPSRSGDRVCWHSADLRDPDAARDLVSRVRPTHLLHLAWEATPRTYIRSPENLLWLQSSLSIVTVFGECGGVRFVGTGSSAEYDIAGGLCAEDATPIRPASIYGKCKAAYWIGVDAAAQHYGFSASWARIFMPYGPGDPPARLIPSVLSAIRENRRMQATSGRQLRDFIYAPDAADLLIRLLFSAATGVFNVGTGVGTPVRRVIEHMVERGGGRDLVIYGAREPAPGEPPMLVADMAKVQRVLGWSPSMSLEAGLDSVLAEWARPA